ncbi:ABC transporter substrate-binding protein [Variovorax humicola]|uniref:ABC transporter substrate-binding protein n=1 Tax=Variovorax humicola TaxID=1769758 RepID=A0ABU8WB94_9BURK
MLPSLGRRRLLVAALVALTQPRIASAQGKNARVSVLASSSETNFGPSVAVFREALKNANWVEGQNLALDVRYSERYEQIPALMAGLLALRPDVIVSLGTPATEEAKRATTTIPIVMESLADVVAAGLVPNLVRPGGNVTGVSGFAPQLSGKRLEMIRELLPDATRIAVSRSSTRNREWRARGFHSRLHGCCTDYRAWDAQRQAIAPHYRFIGLNMRYFRTAPGPTMKRNIRNRRTRTILPPSFTV